MIYIGNSGMEMSHRIHFSYQFFISKMLFFFFFWEKGNKVAFLVKTFCDKLKKQLELKI